MNLGYVGNSKQLICPSSLWQTSVAVADVG